MLARTHTHTPIHLQTPTNTNRLTPATFAAAGLKWAPEDCAVIVRLVERRSIRQFSQQPQPHQQQQQYLQQHLRLPALRRIIHFMRKTFPRRPDSLRNYCCNRTSGRRKASRRLFATAASSPHPAFDAFAKRVIGRRRSTLSKGDRRISRPVDNVLWYQLNTCCFVDMNKRLHYISRCQRCYCRPIATRCHSYTR